jgi:hypothetical protein
MSPVFKRESEYTFKVYSNEEDRMHIHVIQGKSEAKYWLEPQIELAWNDGIAEERLSKIKKIIEKNADRFKEQYKEHVGKRIND